MSFHRFYRVRERAVAADRVEDEEENEDEDDFEIRLVTSAATSRSYPR